MQMLKSNWYTHPLFYFVIVILSLGTTLKIYITSFQKANSTFVDLMKKNNFDASALVEKSSNSNILILTLLISLIIAAMVIIYLYYNKLIRLYRMQQNFINGFTHELKTPVTSLKLFLDNFSKYELPREEQIKYLDYMIRDTKRISDNISQILNLAKFEERQYELNSQLLVMPDFLNELLEKNSHQFKNVKIQINDTTAIKIKADGHLLEVLIMNILTNAILYNESEQALIEIKLEASGKDFFMSFKDNGVGIAKKHLKHIFKKFYRTKKAVKGSGIGLYTAAHIVKLHKGSLHVFSEGPTKGSTFVVKLPRGAL